MSAADIGVIIVAAGSSTRTDGEELKQFRWIAGKPMLMHSLQTFQQRADVAMVVVVLPKQYAGDPRHGYSSVTPSECSFRWAAASGVTRFVTGSRTLVISHESSQCTTRHAHL